MVLSRLLASSVLRLCMRLLYPGCLVRALVLILGVEGASGLSLPACRLLRCGGVAGRESFARRLVLGITGMMTIERSPLWTSISYATSRRLLDFAGPCSFPSAG
ncbi:hypothetical protein EV126DRAFT_147346 [Verticillium dahliae]|nr:hypothetical protein EV126DRAFT_147346 [Verticillium dahliae]